MKRNEKVHCGDCGDKYVRPHAARHRKSCQAGIFSCPGCKFFTYNKQEMNYHVPKKHAPSTSKQSMVCSSCEKEFLSYFSHQQHRRKENGAKQMIK